MAGPSGSAKNAKAKRMFSTDSRLPDANAAQSTSYQNTTCWPTSLKRSMSPRPHWKHNSVWSWHTWSSTSGHMSPTQWPETWWTCRPRKSLRLSSRKCRMLKLRSLSGTLTWMTPKAQPRAPRSHRQSPMERVVNSHRRPEGSLARRRVEGAWEQHPLFTSRLRHRQWHHQRHRQRHRQRHHLQLLASMLQHKASRRDRVKRSRARHMCCSTIARTRGVSTCTS